jgi:bleomycin hydrolase
MARPRKPRAPHDVLEIDWITRATASASAKLLRDRADVKRLRRRGFKAAALDKEVLRQHNRRYTSVLPFGQIENQERSGNCWLFAPVVLVRAAALQKRSVTANASFSETYLYFFDLLEKARRSLFRVHRITARREPLAGETVRQGLKHEVMGLADGGEWEWAFNLIEKYGLVPSQRMPGTASSDDTDALRVDLHERLARAARAIQSRPEKYTVIRDQALRDVVHILVAHLGTPPSDVRFRGRTLSPTEYAEQIVGFRACEWRVVISNPLLAFQRVYERRGSANTGDAPRFNLRRLNVPQRRLRALVRASLKKGYAVGFSADVGRNDIDLDRGIMHPAIFNRARVYGAKVIRDLPRCEDIYLGVASSTHAMAIAGLDSAKPDSDPIKYRVVNSWGPDMGDHGIYHMYAEWFEENVFKLAIHESVLDERDRSAYAHPEAVPGGNFY